MLWRGEERELPSTPKFKELNRANLRTVPTIVTAHTFFASRENYAEKAKLANDFGIQKENWGQPCIFQRK